VPDRPDIHVRLAAVEFFLCHADTFSVTEFVTGGTLEPLTRIELVTFRYGRSTASIPTNCSNNRFRSAMPARLFKKLSRVIASPRFANSSRAINSQG
jgi:hypothetical protein